MKLSPKKFNIFLILKLPAAWLCGVRVRNIDGKKCIVSVKHRWINQNPFKSMFWAVQGMAAELTTGALVMKKIKESGKPISMLVANNNANFSKKATGRILFNCDDGELLDDVIQKAIQTNEGQTIWMKSMGVNKDGIIVSTFNFEWTLKVKSNK